MRIFIRKIYIDGEENFPKNKPVLLACNHPNSFFDGVVFEYFYKYNTKIFTLARGDAFMKPVPNYMLRGLRLLPIFRARDASADVARKGNAKTNEEIYRLFKANHSILIFPEGSAYPEKALRSIKLGTSAMAINMAKMSNFELDLYVVPTALNYSEFGGLRRTIHISYGKPISVKRLKDEIETSERKVMQHLTRHIESALKDQVVRTKGDDEKELEFVHQMMVNENHVQYRYLNKESWKTNIKKANELTEEQINKVKAYSESLKKHGVLDANVSGKSFNLLSMFVAIVTLGISLPVYFIWALMWSGVVKWVHRKITNPIFIDSVIVGIGMLGSAVLAIVVAILFLIFTPAYWSLLFIVSSIYGAICWFRLVDAAPVMWKGLGWNGLSQSHKDAIKSQRNEIISWLK